MRIRNTRWMFWLSVLLSTLGIIGGAWCLKPETMTDLFVQRVIWVLILNFVFWFGSNGWFIQQNNSVNTAVVTTTSIWTNLYCLISLGLMFGSIYINSEYRKYYLIAQIVLCVGYIIILLQLHLSAEFAERDLDIANDAAISPIELSDKLLLVEKQLNKPTDKKTIKQLREKLKYSIPNTNAVRTTMEYKDLARKVLNLNKIQHGKINAAIKDCVFNLEQISKTLKK